VPALEGTRPLLVEVQALAAKAGYGSPQRVANGFDRQRLSLLLAVLERRAGLPFGERDVFVNVVGGLRLADPACDLAVAAALASTALDRPVPRGAVFIGELGLGGELRPVHQAERRLAAAVRAGFDRAFLPERSVPGRALDGIALHPVRTVNELIAELFR
jgi:DNA repair protein RadA/Sms